MELEKTWKKPRDRKWYYKNRDKILAHRQNKRNSLGNVCQCGCGGLAKLGRKFINLHCYKDRNVIKKMSKSLSLRLTGGHGVGKAKRDRLDHFAAKHWIIRDSRGILHEFDNLRSWCRKNESVFTPDKNPFSKTPLYLRACGGLSGLHTGKHPRQSWFGWTLVSIIERKEIGCPDLLNRK